jgi:tetratricopeptide (TPR) repeat protein
LPFKKKEEEKELASEESEPSNWLLRGLTYEEEGNFKKAIDCYKKAMNGTKSDKEAYNNMALVYQALGDFESAESALDEALKLDPEYAIAWEAKGYLYASQNRLDEAVGLFKKALSIGENKPDIWVILGIINATQLKLDDALEHYHKALSLDPNNVNALNNGGLVYHLLSQLREERESIEMLENAVDFFETALSIDPNKAEIWNNYGVVLGFLGRFKAGLRAFEKALLLSPDYGFAYFNRARIYLQMGNRKKAIIHLKKALELDESLYKEAVEDLTLRKMKNTPEFKWLMQNMPKKSN